VYNTATECSSTVFSTFVRPRPGNYYYYYYYYIRRGPGPNKFTRKYLSSFFKFVRWTNI